MYESVLRQLAARGHSIDILAKRRDVPGTATAPEAMLADVPQIRWIWEDTHVTPWVDLGAALRIWLDYLRYRGPRYAGAPRLAERVAERVPAMLLRVSDWPMFRPARGLRVLTAALRKVEQALPRQPELDALMREHRPDVVLLTPLLRLGSSQIEVLRSARARRRAHRDSAWRAGTTSRARRASPSCPTACSCGTRRRSSEAVELHGVPEASVDGHRRAVLRRVVRAAARCGRARRSAPRWACPRTGPSSSTPARRSRPRRPSRPRSCAAGSRGSARATIRCCVRRQSWCGPIRSATTSGTEVELADLPDVTLYGSHPLDEQSKNDYFESLYYCTAVAGLLTSAFLEASVLGRPVHVFVPPEFKERQEGLIHFHYLQTVGGGLLQGDRVVRGASARARRRHCGRRRVRISTPASCARSFVRAASSGRRRRSSWTRSRPSPRRRRRLRRVRRSGRRRCGCLVARRPRGPSRRRRGGEPSRPDGDRTAAGAPPRRASPRRVRRTRSGVSRTRGPRARRAQAPGGGQVRRRSCARGRHEAGRRRASRSARRGAAASSEKRRRDRDKRRAAMVAPIKRRLGVGWPPA